MSLRTFRELPLDKWRWSPSPLPGQVVLVTTCDADGNVDVAPKSWVTMVAFAGPRLGFGCNLAHRTAQNVQATGEFVVNVPGVELAEAIWGMLDTTDRLAGAGLTTTPGGTVAVPGIAECAAHLECGLDRVVEFPGGEVFVLGIVRRVDVGERCLTSGDVADRYAALGTPFFFLESGWCAPLGPARHVASRTA